MKPMFTFLTVAMLVCALVNVALAAPTDEQRHKQKKDEDLEKHLALIEEFLEKAEAAGRKRPVPPPSPEPLTQRQKTHYEKLARDWVRCLWLTNDCFVAKDPFKGYKPEWTYHSGVWTNEFFLGTVDVSYGSFSETRPWRGIEVRFYFEIANRHLRCNFEFWGDGSDNVLMVRNDAYNYSNVFYSVPDHKPIHTNEREARLKAAEYAAMFGVNNLWDETEFEPRAFGFCYGVWEFSLTSYVNGYPTLFPISIHIADLPGYPLGLFYSGMYQIPPNLPTKVVLNAEEAKKNAIAYLKEYFPLKHLIPKLTFHSNRLEYMSPNYNYIRPADDTGFSDYTPKYGDDTLIWNNTFKKPEGTGFPWVSIYVDAATGDMLGGCD